MIGWENYEEYMIMHADGELSPAQEQELMAFIHANPQLEKELAAYELVHLQPDETILYPCKDALLKHAGGRTIVTPLWVRYSVAASVAAILFFSLYRVMRTNNVVNTLAVEDTLKHNLPEKRNAIAVQPQPAPAPATILVPSASVARVSAQNRRIKVRPTMTIVNKKPDTEQNAVVAVVPEHIGRLPVTAAKGLPCGHKETAPALMAVADIPALIPEQESTKKTFWQWLPMEEEKKKRLESIASTIADVYEGSNETKQVADNKKFSLTIKNRKIKVSF